MASSASFTVSICGTIMPCAPISKAPTINASSFLATLINGVQFSDSAALTQFSAVSILKGPCSMSTIIKSSPLAPKILIIEGEGTTHHVPNTISLFLRRFFSSFLFLILSPPSYSTIISEILLITYGVTSKSLSRGVMPVHTPIETFKPAFIPILISVNASPIMAEFFLDVLTDLQI